MDLKPKLRARSPATSHDVTRWVRITLLPMVVFGAAACGPRIHVKPFEVNFHVSDALEVHDVDDIQLELRCSRQAVGFMTAKKVNDRQRRVPLTHTVQRDEQGVAVNLTLAEPASLSLPVCVPFWEFCGCGGSLSVAVSDARAPDYTTVVAWPELGDGRFSENVATRVNGAVLQPAWFNRRGERPQDCSEGKQPFNQACAVEMRVDARDEEGQPVATDSPQAHPVSDEEHALLLFEPVPGN